MPNKPQKTMITIKRRYTRTPTQRILSKTPHDKHGKSIWVGDIIVNPRQLALPNGDYIPALLSHTVDKVFPGNKCQLLEYPDECGPFDTTKFVRVLRATEP
jgi:hypothetical protein